MLCWNEQHTAPKAQLSTYLNRYPNGLVVKCKLRVTQQRIAKGEQLLEKFAYQMQVQAHQLKGKAEGSFACPILVSWTCCDAHHSSGEYFVALTFNKRAFGRQTPEAIKKLIKCWIHNAWAKVLWLKSDTVYPMVKLSPGQPYTLLSPGKPEYRYLIEDLERAFSGHSPHLSAPLAPFRHRQGFYPKGLAKK